MKNKKKMSVTYRPITYEESEEELVKDIDKFVNERIDANYKYEVKNLIKEALLYVLSCHSSGCHIDDEIFESAILPIVSRSLPEEINSFLNAFRRDIGLKERDNFKLVQTKE
jgi:hypothetical protein